MYVPLGSIISAVCDNTGDDGADAVAKVVRLINTHGPDYCNLADWKFLRSDLSFSLTVGTADYTSNGTTYIPDTFKRVLAAYITDGTERFPLNEVGIGVSHNPSIWGEADDNQGIPSQFEIPRLESDHWTIRFNCLPDAAYTAYFEIETMWTEVTLSTANTCLTEEHLKPFSHFITMERLAQQGDIEQYQIYKDRWHSPMNPEDSILNRILSTLVRKTGRDGVYIDMGNTMDEQKTPEDYNK